MKIKVIIHIPDSGTCVGCKYYKMHIREVSPVDDVVTFHCQLFKRKIKNDIRCEECRDCEVMDK